MDELPRRICKAFQWSLFILANIVVVKQLIVNIIIDDGASGVVNVYCSPCASDGICPLVLSTCVDTANKSHIRFTFPALSTYKFIVNIISDDGASDVINVYCNPCASDRTWSLVLSTWVDAADEMHIRVTPPKPSAFKLDVNSLGDNGANDIVNV